ncbi:type II secretion system protein GspL [Aestuariicoccus sp. MJ-SS9]|uniref:type II secretion system protein GspL n=1 Tax=Aestuariicoccus sp. MJ-SS9 TaxID=3079855 RepID=UPI00290DAF01|nr:type II secretion system protein GspL [Aestuariicoccus sp. MJ-SS9]MDU8912180.1 type II secretion system protein GspL [Aestuariicoccus sp. MJ-SS9]
MAAGTKETDFVPLDGAAAPPGARKVALVPGALAPVLTLDLPRGLRGAAREDVARRQLRDLTGQAPDTLQMRPFHGPGGARGWTRALVADAGQVAAWRDRAGRACRAVLPDYLALPTTEGVWSFEMASGALRARLGPGDGFTAAEGPARLMLERALSAGAPRAALIAGPAPDWLRALLEGHEVPLAASPDEIAKLGLPRPERLTHGELAFDLRKDPLAERSRLRRNLLPWRWPVLAGGVALGIWAAAQIVATTETDRAAAALRDGTLARVRADFVPAGPILDIRAQVSRALADRRRAAEAWRGRSSPLVLFGQAAGVIAGAGAETEEVAFGPEQGLVVVLRLPDFAAVDRLVAGLRAAGLSAEVADARAGDGATGVRAELRIGEGET